MARMLFFLDYDDGQGGRFVNSPGLLPLVGYTRACGFDVEFVTNERELLWRLDEPQVNVVGFSSMERLLPRTLATANRVREARPELVLMLGGNAIDPFAPALAAHLFDLVVLGEAEHVLPALLQALTGPASPPDGLISGANRAVCPALPGGALSAAQVDAVLNAAFRRQDAAGHWRRIRIGGVHVRDSTRGTVWYLEEPRLTSLERMALGDVALGSAPRADELDQLCLVPWDVVEREGWKHFEFYTQRGCRWGRCRFCSVADRDIRALSPEKVVEVVSEAVDRGVEMVSFADDLFVQHPSWNLRLIQLLRARGLRTEFRAQTTPNRALWPLLPGLREIGFSELAFGVETLSSERAEFMRKTYNGTKYLEGARETITRTARHGIFPVLYLILADPSSTLPVLADELVETVRVVEDVYEATSVVPKLSYSLMLLPVANTELTARFQYRSLSVELGASTLALPFEFEFPRPVALFLSAITEGTRALPLRRENLAALQVYLRALVEVAGELPSEQRAHVEQRAAEGLDRFERLLVRFQRDADRLCDALLGASPSSADRVSLDFRRFGACVPTIQHIHTRLTRPSAPRRAEEARSAEPERFEA